MSNNDKDNDKAKKPESQKPKSKIDDDAMCGEERPRTWSRFALASRLRDLDRG